MSYRLPPVEIERCHSKKCKWEKRRWIAGRGGKFSRCEGCGDRFPCAHNCTHVDCREVREKINGVSPSKPETTDEGHDKLASSSVVNGESGVEGSDGSAGSAKEKAAAIPIQTQLEGEHA